MNPTLTPSTYPNFSLIDSRYPLPSPPSSRKLRVFQDQELESINDGLSKLVEVKSKEAEDWRRRYNELANEKMEKDYGDIIRRYEEFECTTRELMNENEELRERTREMGQIEQEKVLFEKENAKLAELIELRNEEIGFLKQNALDLETQSSLYVTQINDLEGKLDLMLQENEKLNQILEERLESEARDTEKQDLILLIGKKDEQIDDLLRENQELNESKEKLTSIISNLQEKNMKDFETLNHLTHKVESLLTDNEKLNILIDEKNQITSQFSIDADQFHKLSLEYAALEKLNEEKVKFISNQAKKIIELESSITGFESKIETLLDYNERLNQLTMENQAKIKLLRSDTTLNFTSRNILEQKFKDISFLEQDLTRIEALAVDYKLKMETFMAQIDILEGDLYEKEGALTLLKKENEGLKLNFIALEKNYTSLVGKVSELQLKKSYLEQKKEKNRDKIRRYKGENRNLEQLKIFLGNLKREIVGSDIDFEGKYQDIESIKGELEGKNEEIMREITNLSVSLVNKKEELTKLAVGN